MRSGGGAQDDVWRTVKRMSSIIIDSTKKVVVAGVNYSCNGDSVVMKLTWNCRGLKLLATFLRKIDYSGTNEVYRQHLMYKHKGLTCYGKRFIFDGILCQMTKYQRLDVYVLSVFHNPKSVSKINHSFRLWPLLLKRYSRLSSNRPEAPNLSLDMFSYYEACLASSSSRSKSTSSLNTGLSAMLLPPSTSSSPDKSQYRSEKTFEAAMLASFSTSRVIEHNALAICKQARLSFRHSH